MVQIKLSIAFVLAAAAIAPVVALPIGEELEVRADELVRHSHRVSKLFPSNIFITHTSFTTEHGKESPVLD